MSRIGVDLDNTTLDWQGHWADLYALWFDRYVDPAVLDTWNACIDGTHFDSMVEFYDWFAKADGWRTLPYLPGALGGLDTLLSAGHNIEFITARPKAAEGDTWEWFRGQRWGQHRRCEMSITRGKWQIPCSVYVDDAPEMIEGLLEHGKTVIVFDRPWNRQKFTAQPGRLHRALDWAGVVKLVEELS